MSARAAPDRHFFDEGDGADSKETCEATLSLRLKCAASHSILHLPHVSLLCTQLISTAMQASTAMGQTTLVLLLLSAHHLCHRNGTSSKPG